MEQSHSKPKNNESSGSGLIDLGHLALEVLEGSTELANVALVDGLAKPTAVDALRDAMEPVTGGASGASGGGGHVHQ